MDGLPTMLLKAIDLVEAVYLDIDTMEGSLLRILRVMTSTTNASVVMIMGSLIEHPSRGWQTKSPTPGIVGEGESEGLKLQKCSVDLHT